MAYESLHHFPIIFTTWIESFEMEGPFELGPMPKSRATGTLLKLRRFKRVLYDTLRKGPNDALENLCDVMNQIHLAVRIDEQDPSLGFLRFERETIYLAKKTPIE